MMDFGLDEVATMSELLMDELVSAMDIVADEIAISVEFLVDAAMWIESLFTATALAMES